MRIICLRAGPRDVPATSGVLWTSILAALLSYIVVIASQLELSDALPRVVLDLLILVALLHGGLKITGRPERFGQGYAALCGTGALLNLAFWLVLPMIDGGGGAGAYSSASIALLLLYAWSLVVVAHIFRHCFDTSMAVGMMVSIAYLVVAVAIANALFPTSTVVDGGILGG